MVLPKIVVNQDALVKIRLANELAVKMLKGLTCRPFKNLVAEGWFFLPSLDMPTANISGRIHVVIGRETFMCLLVSLEIFMCSIESRAWVEKFDKRIILILSWTAC